MFASATLEYKCINSDIFFSLYFAGQKLKRHQYKRELSIPYPEPDIQTQGRAAFLLSNIEYSLHIIQTLYIVFLFIQKQQDTVKTVIRPSHLNLQPFPAIPAISSHFLPFPAISSHSQPFQTIPAYSSLVQPITAIPSQFQPITSNSSLFQHIPANSSLFPRIPSYSSLCQPI